jgi:hypothetical protein
MSYQLQGKVKAIGETTQVSEKFKKRDLVITDDSSMYPQDISFQFAQDKCEDLDSVSVGDLVKVSFNIKGREWTSPQGEVKYFNTLEGWRVESLSEAPKNAEPQTGGPSATASDFDDEEDDLPF